MARIRTGRSRRRRPRSSRDEDLMSALPDDLLLLVLRRLDTRTALGTALLSTRWARLHRELSVLDFRVGSMLPPRYHRLLLLLDDMDIKDHYLRYKRRCELRPKIRRYERGAMRALSRSVESFLDDEGARRSVSRLKLEFFITHNPDCMNRLIAKSIDEWGLSDLEAVAKPIDSKQSAHTFPSHGLCQAARASCLRSLRLGGCALPPLLHEFTALTMLVLQDIKRSTPREAYEGVFTLCTQLQVLHLKSCDCPSEETDLVVDAPSSQIRELVLDRCRFGQVRMRALPNLESLASLDTTLHFDQSASFPRLRQCNHATWVGSLVFIRGRPREYIGHQRELNSFLGRTPYITNLVLRFTGPRRWIVPPPTGSPSPSLPKLRKLLVADVPSSWDVSWPRLLLEMAPSLETLHIHIAPCSGRAGRAIPWEPTELRRRHLKEFVVAGFQGTKRHICFVKFVVGVSTSLRRVALFRNGRAEDKGHWDWEMVTEEHSWTNRQRNATQKKIMDGVSFSRSPPRFVFG